MTEMTRKPFLTIAIGVLTTVSALSDPAQIVIPATITPQTTDPLVSWLAQETSYALDGVLNNVGPNGAKATGASSGIIIASPSQSNPDYYYTWTRDAALTVKYLVGSFAADHDPAIQRIIEDYVESQAHLQTVSNPSGNLSSGGLGEPKLRVDGSAFHGSWGRPQSDGPALRATTLISYANLMIDNGYFSTVESSIWPIIQNDLSYLTEFWNSSTFGTFVCFSYGRTVMLDAGEEFEYKFIRKRVGDGKVIWEEGQNRAFVVPRECGPSNATINAVWR